MIKRQWLTLDLTGFYQKTKSLCLVVTSLVTYKIYTTYQSTYFIDVFVFKASLKIQKLSKSVNYIKSFAQNKF